MNTNLRKLLALFLLLVQQQLLSQEVSFSHLNASNGLSDNNVLSMVIDKNGFLWIGTRHGLNVYDGYSITSYFKDNHPELTSDAVIHLTCDSRNRIWLGSYEGVSWLDEKRNFNKVLLFDTVFEIWMQNDPGNKTHGIVIYTSLGQFYFDSLSKKMDANSIGYQKKLAFSKFLDAEPYGEDQIIYCTYTEVLILDYSTRKIIYEKTL